MYLDWVGHKVLAAPRLAPCCIAYQHFHRNGPIDDSIMFSNINLIVNEVAMHGLTQWLIRC